jgi:hypothetical protein
MSDDENVFRALQLHDNWFETDDDVLITLTTTVTVVVFIFVTSFEVFREVLFNLSIGLAVA